jgi:hypothetical protein
MTTTGAHLTPRRRMRVAALLAALSLLLSVGAVEPASAARPQSSTHGAGTNNPNYNNGSVNVSYRCLDSGVVPNFKITGARMVMWSNGARIKGFHFKYRLVAHGTDGQLQYWSNWSDNVSVSFPQGTPQAKWMSAPALSQSFSTASAWDVEAKVKYPRSLRTAYRYKWRINLTNPACE